MTCNFKAIIKNLIIKWRKTMRRMNELTINRGIFYLLSIYQNDNDHGRVSVKNNTKLQLQ